MMRKLSFKLKRFIKHLQYSYCTKDNVNYKNKYSGKCFILGAGPSLKDVDLNSLTSETIFGLNFLYLDERLSPQYIKFWLIIDVFLNPVTEFYREKIEELDKFLLPDTIIFVPVEARKYICEFNIFQNKKIVYLSFSGCLWLGDDDKMDYLSMMNLTKPIIAYHNVVGFAINCAIYMGFVDLFLLGCDSDWFMYEGKKIQHSCKYGIIDDSDKTTISLFDMSSRENKLLYGYLLYKEYRLLCNAVLSLGVHVFDCTEGGMLDMFPKLALMDALSYTNKAS